MTATTATTHATALLPLDRLIISPLNVRKHSNKDVATLAHTIASKGLLQALVVRPAADGTFEVMAGQRRLRALQKLAKTKADTAFLIDPVSCLVVSGADDADAIAMSLTENVERVPMDELDEYQAFSAMLKAGRNEEEIAVDFALPVATVRKRLAIARLIPAIHRAYRDERINAAELQTLTLATRKQQTEYLALLDDPRRNTPPHYKLKAWILGGQEISTDAALFPLEGYQGETRRDLFGEQSYFADADLFWQHQTQGIEALRSRIADAGWADVKVVGPHERFEHWQYLPVPKSKGGHYIIEVLANGRVEQHKGMLPRAQALRATRATEASAACDAAADHELTEPAAPDRPELSGSLCNYIDTVRLAAVRAALLAKPQFALRLLLAQLIAGARHITIKPEPMTPASSEITGALQDLSAIAIMDEARSRALNLLGRDATEHSLLQGYDLYNADTPHIFARLLELDTRQVNSILAVLVAETLSIGTGIVDAAGAKLDVDVASIWSPDDTFFALIRDRAVSTAILAEVAPDRPPPSLATTTKEMKSRIRDALKVKSADAPWLPRWMSFPAAAYTDRPLTSRPRHGA
jgi:ParB family transcriptional regulator, chromosome partitioning protein